MQRHGPWFRTEVFFEDGTSIDCCVYDADDAKVGQNDGWWFTQTGDWQVFGFETAVAEVFQDLGSLECDCTYTSDAETSRGVWLGLVGVLFWASSSRISFILSTRFLSAGRLLTVSKNTALANP